MFPELVAVCKQLPVKTVIIDGEAIVYDPNTHTYLAFQETVKRKRKHDIEEISSELPLQLAMFDIMYLDGKSLLQEEQKTRRKLLTELFENYKKSAVHTAQPQQLGLFTQNQEQGKDVSCEYTLQVIAELPVSTPKELEDYFMQEIASGLEGVVVKKTDSLYQAGKRSFNWIKLKYQASDKLKDTLDVVILGYYPGRGKRASFGIGAFLVGVYNRELDLYQTVAKIGTGLTDQAWIDLKVLCDTHAVAAQPKEVICAKQLHPLVWIAPVIVCEVLADEITFSPLHTAGQKQDQLGLALRFPRFVKLRKDKAATQTTTVVELLQLKNFK
jgi:DNA ligase-1